MNLTNNRFAVTIKGFKSLLFTRVQLSRGSADWGEFTGTAALERVVTTDDHDLYTWAAGGDERDIVVTSLDEKGGKLAVWTLAGATPQPCTYCVGPFVTVTPGLLSETLIVRHRGVKV